LLLTIRLGSPLIQDIQDHPHTVLVSGWNKIMLPLACENKVSHTHEVYNQCIFCKKNGARTHILLIFY
jgi:hypothetical protein